MRRFLIAVMVLAAVAVTVLLVARPDTQTSVSSSPSREAASVLPTPASVTVPPSPPLAPTPAAAAASPDQSHEPAGTPVPLTGAVPAGDAEQSAAWAQATTRAVGFMRSFARPPAGVSATAWWATVQSYLAPAAAADYSGTDPANVPFTTVTGPATVVPVEAPAELVIVVRVPTDSGDYLVEIETTPTGPWVTRATPADSR